MAHSSPASNLNTSIERQIPVGFVLAVVIIVVIGVLSSLNIQASIETSQLVTHTREVLQQLEDTQITLLDTETNVRGYYISGNEAYLPPYQAAVRLITDRLARLRALTADNPTQLATLDKLDPLIATRLQQLQTTVNIRQSAPLTDASAQAEVQAQLTPSPVKQTMDDIRSLISTMIAEEDNLLAPRVRAAETSARGTLLTMLLLSSLTVLILIVVYLLFRRDITGRKRVETALNAERSVLRTLVDALPDQIFIKQPNGAFLLTNRAFAANLGLTSPEAMLGKTDFEFFPHDMAELYHADDLTVFKTGTPIINREEPIALKDGRTMIALTTKIPLRGLDGSVERIVGISHDITERKANENHIQALNQSLERRTEQVEAANKELEAFSYTISHDLRAPLRAIRGFSKIVLDEYSDQIPSEGRRFLKLVDDNARQMSDLIDDLLSFSRLSRQPVNRETINPTELARSVWNDLIAESPDRQVEFVLAEMPGCEADRTLLRQVYTNLLANALKFTSKHENARVEVGSERQDNLDVYFVRDNGAGFNMRYYNKLFGVFQRLHRAEDYEGTGVGLAIIQRIIVRHGGKVWAEGEVDHGATFYFTLTGEET